MARIRPSTSSNSPDHNGRPPNTYCSITTKPHTITNASPTNGGVGGAVAVIDRVRQSQTVPHINY